MILVGLDYVWRNCAGAESTGKYFFEAIDLHDAAQESWKTTWANPWQTQTILGGEFHDTETRRTWSVDGCGHSKKDYRTEETNLGNCAMTRNGKPFSLRTTESISCSTAIITTPLKCSKR